VFLFNHCIAHSYVPAMLDRALQLSLRGSASPYLLKPMRTIKNKIIILITFIVHIEQMLKNCMHSLKV